MRSVSNRFRELLSSINRWVTVVEWTNDGGRTWNPSTYVDGTCTAAATSQVRWTAGLTLTDVGVSLDALNPFSSQLRILHGIYGEPLLPMGRYKVATVEVSSEQDHLVKVEASSREVYLIAAQFTSSRTFYAQPARQLVTTLISEVLGAPSIDWRMPTDPQMPKIIQDRERWALIDGDRDSTSVARAVGGRVYAGAGDEWIVAPVPALSDDAVWEAHEGEGGVLVSSSEQLTDDGVFNIQVAAGQSGSGVGFTPGVAQDNDPLSPTYVGRPVSQGGVGPRPRFYTSQLITNSAQAKASAQAMLAPYLGLRQKVAFSQLHDPTIEPGDVGIVHTRRGPRRVILDSVTYDLTGQPLTAETRTTATRLAGDVVALPDDGGDDA